MKFAWRLIATTAVAAAAGVYALHRFLHRREKAKAPFDKNMPAAYSDVSLLQKCPYRMMTPIFWAGIE
jgi:hypothetical protein